MYTVYKITNILNKKYYIGVHKTNDPYDSYMGSGLAIKEAIKKYGRLNFEKEILLITEKKEEAYKKEIELTKDFNTNSNYNMRLGGLGGFTKENARKGYDASLGKITQEQRSLQGKRTYSVSLGVTDLSAAGRKGGLANKGRPKSATHIENMRIARLKKTLS